MQNLQSQILFSFTIQMKTMDVQHKQEGSKGMFFIQGEENTVAEMTYSNAIPDQMVIQHTWVDEKLRGKNVGYELVESAVEYARQHSLTITPQCSFAKSVFDKNPAFTDVIQT